MRSRKRCIERRVCTFALVDDAHLRGCYVQLTTALSRELLGTAICQSQYVNTLFTANAQQKPMCLCNQR